MFFLRNFLRIGFRLYWDPTRLDCLLCWLWDASNAFSYQAICPLLYLAVQDGVVILHNRLHGLGGGQQVPETAHPHVSVFYWPGTQVEKPLTCLKIHAKLPVLRHCVACLSLREIAIQNVTKQYFLPIRLICTFFIWFNCHNCCLEID